MFRSLDRSWYVALRAGTLMLAVVLLGIAPWWVTVVVVLIAMVVFSFGLEFLFLLLIMELLFGGEQRFMQTTWYGPATIGGIFFLLIELLRSRVRLLESFTRGG